MFNIYGAEDGFTNAGISMAVVAYSVATSGTLLVLGRLSNHVGRRPAALTSLSLLVLALPGIDVFGGDVQKRTAGAIRAGGRLVTIAGPAEAGPANGLAIDFVVESDRAQLGEIVRRVRDGRLRTNIGNVATLDDAVAAFNPTERISGQTIIRVRPQGIVDA